MYIGWKNELCIHIMGFVSKFEDDFIIYKHPISITQNDKI